MNIFESVPSIDWGFTAADIFSNAIFIVGSLAAFVLLGLAINYAPAIIDTIRGAAAYKAAYGKSHTAGTFFSDIKMFHEERQYLGQRWRRR